MSIAGGLPNRRDPSDNRAIFRMADGKTAYSRMANSLAPGTSPAAPPRKQAVFISADCDFFIGSVSGVEYVCQRREAGGPRSVTRPVGSPDRHPGLLRCRVLRL